MAIDRPQPAISEADADARLAANNRDILALLAKADNRMRSDDHRAANAYYSMVGQLAGQGVPIAREDYQRASDAVTWLADRFRQHVLDALDSRGFTKAERHPRFAKSLEIMFGERQRDPESAAFPQMPQLYFYPDLPYFSFADPAAFEWRDEVERATDAIRAEGLALEQNASSFDAYVQPTKERPQGDVHGLVGNADWSTFELTENGVPAEERIAQCPQTHAAIAEQAPLCDIVGRAPTIMFSRLRANSRIPPHTGMINARYICHLPLVVPGDGALRVGDKQHAWQEGTLLAFDDSVEHEAWNNASKDRLVLIFDIWRPELEQAERSQIRTLFEAVDSY